MIDNPETRNVLFLGLSYPGGRTTSMKEEFPFEGYPLEDGLEGVQIFGSTGSGKSSGPMWQMKSSFLANGLGGLVLCAKPDEAGNWREAAKNTGRQWELIFLSENRFDFIKYEAKRTGDGGGETENIVNLLMEAAEIAGTKGGSKGDKFWTDAAKELLRNCIDFLKFSGQEITLRGIRRTIVSAPKSPEELVPGNEFLDKLSIVDDSSHPDKEMVVDYFTRHYPNLADKTRSSIEATISSLVDVLCRGKIGECFSSGECTFVPEDIFDRRKIVVCDFDVKEYDIVGQYANVILKYIFQKAVERRRNTHERVFLFADEAHFFLSGYDNKFQTTARSSGCISVYATQGISNYWEVLGKEKTSSFLGNLQLKVFCQNSDSETNRYASELIGYEIRMMSSGNTSTGNSYSFKGGSSNSSGSSSGWSEQRHCIVEPNTFLTLATGGLKNSCFVEAYVVSKNTRGKYLKLLIPQNCSMGCSPRKKYECWERINAEWKKRQKVHNGPPWYGNSCLLMALMILGFPVVLLCVFFATLPEISPMNRDQLAQVEEYRKKKIKAELQRKEAERKVEIEKQNQAYLEKRAKEKEEIDRRNREYQEQRARDQAEVERKNKEYQDRRTRESAVKEQKTLPAAVKTEKAPEFYVYLFKNCKNIAVNQKKYSAEIVARKAFSGPGNSFSGLEAKLPEIFAVSQTSTVHAFLIGEDGKIADIKDYKVEPKKKYGTMTYTDPKTGVTITKPVEIK